MMGMNSTEAHRIIHAFGRNDNPNEEDTFAYVEALRFLVETENDARAMSALGGHYYGLEKYDLAEKYYLMADENGDDYASNGLGFIYYYGRVGTPNYPKAFHYYSKAMKLGNKEAAMKIADMYHNGYGVEKDETKYKALLLKLFEEVKDTDLLFEPYPEIAHRLADIYIAEGHPFDALPMLIRAKSMIEQRIRYNPFWGNFIVCRRVITRLYKIIPFDEYDFDFFDLFYYLYTPHKVELTYQGKTYVIESFIDEERLRVKCDGQYYKSIEDFLMRALFEGKHTYVIHYEDYYSLECIDE